MREARTAGRCVCRHGWGGKDEEGMQGWICRGEQQHRSSGASRAQHRSSRAEYGK